MEVKHRLLLPITESSQVAEARRLTSALARSLGFNETVIGKVALVVTECATNLVKHTTKGGEILVNSLEKQGVLGIEILTLDKGPGISNISDVLRDGYTTASSPGTGLGAIVRLSDYFDIHSTLGIGTAVLTRLWASPFPEPQTTPLFDLGAVSIPKPGEEVCGDGWALHLERTRGVLLLVDGLGHGIGAADAARDAIATFGRVARSSPVAIVEDIHQALRRSRGAVLGVLEIDVEKHEARFSGVGNIEGSIYSGNDRQNLVSHNGTAGYEVGRIREYTYPYADDAITVMHSDGCTTQLSLKPYVGLTTKAAALIAGVLYRDYNRGRDDVTVLVVKRTSTRIGSQLKPV